MSHGGDTQAVNELEPLNSVVYSEEQDQAANRLVNLIVNQDENLVFDNAESSWQVVFFSF